MKRKLLITVLLSLTVSSMIFAANSVERKIRPSEVLKNKIAEFQAEMPSVDVMGYVQEALTEDWTGDAWVNSELEQYSYDAHGNQTQILSKSWDGSAWQNDGKAEITYNSANGISSMKQYSYESGSWVLFLEMLNTYNAQGLPVTMTSSSYDNGTMIGGSKTTVVYDGSGNTTEMYTEMWNPVTQAWGQMSKTTFSVEGGKEVEVVQMWNGAAYVNTERYETTNDAQGRQGVTTYFLWDGSAWQKSARDTFTYDGTSQNWTLWLTEDWNGSQWVNSYKYEYSYDAHGNESEYMYSTWDGTQWVVFIGTKSEYTYNDDNWVSVEIGYTWFLNSWLKVYRTTYTYDRNVEVTDRPDAQLPQAYALGNYPNPFNPTTTIEFRLPSDQTVTLNVYNSNGVLIKSLVQNQRLSTGLHTMSWDGTNMLNQKVSSGVYLYRLVTPNQILSQKCLLVK